MNRLKELRESLDMSVEEFAKLFRVHRSSMYRYEGTNVKEPREIPIELAVEISEKFNVSLDWLAGTSNVKFRDNKIDILTEIYNKLSDAGRQELFNFALFLKSKEEGK